MKNIEVPKHIKTKSNRGREREESLRLKKRGEKEKKGESRDAAQMTERDRNINRGFKMETKGKSERKTVFNED